MWHLVFLDWVKSGGGVGEGETRGNREEIGVVDQPCQRWKANLYDLYSTDKGRPVERRGGTLWISSVFSGA